MRNQAQVIGSARIAARRRAVHRERRRLRRRIAVAVLMVGAAAYGGLSLTRSSVFRLEHIEVTGATLIGSDRIIEASGLQPGIPALSIDLNAAAAGVRALPEIADARIERVGSLALRIVVDERVAAIEVRSVERSIFLDATGFEVEAPKARKALPVLQVEAVGAGGAAVDAETVKTALTFWRRIGWRMRTSVESMSVTNGAVRFTMGDTTIVVGTLEQLALKMGVLDAIQRRARADERRVVYVDLRSPSRPAVRVA